MVVYLKQSTSSQEILLGPFLDETDGITALTSLTINNTDIDIWKTGATAFASKNSGGATHISDGMYYATLDATDTNTLGSMIVFIKATGALPVRHEFVVLAANIYDSLIGATDNLEVDTASIWSAGTRTLTAIDEDSTTLDLDNTIRTSIGVASANLDTQLSGLDTKLDTIDDFLDTEIASILEDTGTTIPGLIGALNDLSAAEVNAEVLDVLNVDTFSQPGQESPAATQTIAKMLAYLYKAWRNKVEQTSTTYSLYADDGTTVDQEASVSDDGATFTRNEMTTGA